MGYPVVAVTRPANLTGQPNGKLDASLLTSLDAPGRPLARAHTQTVRSWRAMCAEVVDRFGETLTVTSNHDGYRSYAIQESTFRSRYAIGGSYDGCKQWDSNGDGNRETWCKKGNYATAATPGTSNHGWGLALDVCLWRDQSIVAITANTSLFGWLLANEGRYGFSHEIQSEPWHLRLFTGDDTPKAVIDFEKPPPPMPPHPDQEDDELNQDQANELHAAYLNSAWTWEQVQAIDARLQALEVVVAATADKVWSQPIPNQITEGVNAAWEILSAAHGDAYRAAHD